MFPLDTWLLLYVILKNSARDASCKILSHLYHHRTGTCLNKTFLAYENVLLAFDTIIRSFEMAAAMVFKEF